MKVKPKLEAGKVKVYGEGVSPSKAVPASIPTEFVVDTTDAGFGDLEVQVLGPDNYPRKVKVIDNGDGKFKVGYTPDDCGRYKINVKYGGKDVPHSPFPVQSVATGSVSKKSSFTLFQFYFLRFHSILFRIFHISCFLFRRTNAKSPKGSRRR